MSEGTISSTELKTLVYGSSRWLDAYRARTATPLTKFHAGMQYFFRVQAPKEFIDVISIQIAGRVAIDIFKFDDYLHKIHGKYDEGPDAISIRDLIAKHYGEEAATFVESYI